MTSTSLVHRLFAEADIRASDILVDFDREETIPYYALSNGDYISDRIQEALYEYGLTYRATLDGKFRILDISPDEITPEATIGTTQLRTEFSLARSDSSQKGSVVKWYPVLTRAGAEIFLADTGDAQTISALEAYPIGADADGYRLPYDISEYAGTGKLLSIENPRIEYTPTSLAVDAHAEFGQDDCSAYLKSTSTKDQTITRFAVIADIRYKGSTASQQIVPGTKPKTYTAKVISDKGSALRLARILASRQTVGKQAYGFDSPVQFEPGMIVRVIEDKVSHLDVTVRIVSCEYSVSTGLYTYVGEGVTDIDLTTTVERIDAIENALGKPRKGHDGAKGERGATGPQGLQGLQGVRGDQGVQGPTGADGLAAYNHIAYADTSVGGGFSQSPTRKTYIGFYSDHTETDSSTASDYNWSLIKGSDGAQGIQGPTGTDGKTSYFHTAWANSANGATGFSTTVSAGKLYIGVYSDHIAADSTNYANYSWTLIKGEKGDTGATGARGLQGLQGVKGDQGIQGPTGADGLASYNHIAYADNSSGGGFSQSPTGKAYIGFYADHTATDSTDASKYLWSLIKGADGAQGIQGPTGADGQTSYFHTAWADSANGATGFSTTVSVGKFYIGVYSDHTAADSTNYASYSWTLIKGEKGDTGATGTQGNQGEPGKAAYALALNADSYVITFSSRGVLKTNQVVLTAIVSNIPIDSIAWECSDGTLSQIELSEGVFDQYRRILDCSTVTGDSAVISVSATYGGKTYSTSIGIAKVSEGLPTPVYIGAVSQVPTLTDEGPLVAGDFFLYTGTYTGTGTDPGNVGLNPVYSATGEFIYGRIYEYNGKDSDDLDIWSESRKSEHLAAAQADALMIAKNTNTYLFVAVLVAQLGLFQDLLVYATLKSTNYAQDANGVPTSGFSLDGINGIIKVLGLEAYSAMIYGNLEASGFRTLQEETGVTIPASAISGSLWKHSEMTGLISDSECFEPISGIVEGFAFIQGTKRNNSRILLDSHGWENETISAQEAHIFSKLNPDRIFGNSFFYAIKGSYSGNFSKRTLFRMSSDARISMSTGTNTWILSGGSAEGIRSFGENYYGEGTVNLDNKYTRLAMVHGSYAYWGSKSSRVEYLKMYTTRTFSGLVLRSAENNILNVGFEPFAYYPDTIAWQIGEVTQADKNTYVSGTDFYNLFASLQIGSDGYCDGGQINVNGSLYSITRLAKGSNSLTFYTSGGVVSVSKFQEGTSVGVYTQLAITEAINFQAVTGGIETKHIFPWGTQAGSPGNYDIGTQEARFGTAWLSYLDILNDVLIHGKLMIHGNLLVGGSCDSESVSTKDIHATGSEGTRSAGSRSFGATIPTFGTVTLNSSTWRPLTKTLKLKKKGIYTLRYTCYGASSYSVYIALFVNGLNVGPNPYPYKYRPIYLYPKYKCGSW